MPPTAYEQIRIRGQNTLVPVVRIDNAAVVATGRFVKLARVKDEELVEGELVADPSRFVGLLKRSGLRADLFTFAERPPQTSARYPYHTEWDNWAVVPITTYQDWWEKRLPQESRKNVRRAEKRGVTVKTVPFTDELVAGIQNIYNETPVRQGRRFWHFGKSTESVKAENETYLERSAFVGAFLGDQLIGFLKIVYVDRIAVLIQILAMNEHHDKRPMNAMLAHAVDLCVKQKMSFLVYGQYSYGNEKETSLAEFKRRNGFEEVRFPRYYVPLTAKGRLAIKSGLHLGTRRLLPGDIVQLLHAWRRRLYSSTWLARGSAAVADPASTAK